MGEVMSYRQQEENEMEQLETLRVLRRVSRGLAGEEDALFLASKLGLRERDDNALRKEIA